MYKIRMGIPEMQELWNTLEKKYKEQTANKNELKLFKLLVSCFLILSNDPRYPGLCTHDIDALTRRYGERVWQSYLENNKPAAGRIFWIYGPDKNDITIIGLEPHPNDKKDAYQKITLSAKPESQSVTEDSETKTVNKKKKK